MTYGMSEEEGLLVGQPVNPPPVELVDGYIQDYTENGIKVFR